MTFEKAKTLFVAGCGHDGRLGTGNEKNHHKFAPLTHFQAQLERQSAAAPANSNGINSDSTTVGVIDVKTVIAGGFHSFAVDSEGKVYSFGLNEFGQLGLGHRAASAKVPQLVPFFEKRWQQGHLAAPINNNDSASKGDEGAGGFAPPCSEWLSPQCGLIALSCGAYHTVALCHDGLFVCGANDNGQLGLGHFDHAFDFTNATPNAAPIARPPLLSTVMQTTMKEGGEKKADSDSCAAANAKKSPNGVDNEDGVGDNDEHQQQCWEVASGACGSDAVSTTTTTAIANSRGRVVALPPPSPTRQSSSASASSAFMSRLDSIGQIVGVRCGSYHTVVVTRGMPMAEEERLAAKGRLAAFWPSQSNDDTEKKEEDKEGSATEQQRRRRTQAALALTTTSSFDASSSPSGLSEAQDELRRLIDRALEVAKEEDGEGKKQGGRGGAAGAVLLCCSNNNNGEKSADEAAASFGVFACGKGDFGELGYDADEWDKLSAMEKRLKQHVSSKAAFMAQGGRGEDYADFKVSASGRSGAATAAPKPSPFAKFKPSAAAAKPARPVRRSEFSSHTFRRVAFPVLDYGLLLFKAATAAESEEEQPKRITINAVEAAPFHHHTAVRITYRQPTEGVRGEEEEREALFHFGCYYADKVETVESSIPRLVTKETFLQLVTDVNGNNTPRTTTITTNATDFSAPKFIHAGDEILFGVFPPAGAAASASSADIEASTAPQNEEEGPQQQSDTILVIGKGNLGFGDDDDFVVEGKAKTLYLPKPQLLGEDAISALVGDEAAAVVFSRYSVRSIAGKSHFFFTARWHGVVDGKAGNKSVFVDVVYAFGDNFMGQCALDSDDNAILTPQQVLIGAPQPLVVAAIENQCAAGSSVGSPVCGFRHSLVLM